MRIAKVKKTFSPSMDIQVSSNFERQLFESVKRDSSIVNKIMKSFYDTGNQVLSQNIIFSVHFCGLLKSSVDFVNHIEPEFTP